MSKESIVKQYGKGENNLPQKICDWMNEHTHIIGETDDGFIFGISTKETEEYIKQLKGNIKPTYIYNLRLKAMSLYRYYNEGCTIKWID